MEPQYLTERQVSQMTGIKISTLRNHRHRRVGLPFIKYGSMVLYKIEDVQEYLDDLRIDCDYRPKKGKKSTANEGSMPPQPSTEKITGTKSYLQGESDTGAPMGRKPTAANRASQPPLGG